MNPMLLYLALKNIITKKSSYVIILFIAFAIMMLVVTNAIFDSTENGIQETFVSSFTGDVVIRPKNNVPLSLFGDETPVTGKLAKIPVLFPYPGIREVVESDPRIKAAVPQITGQIGVTSKNTDDGIKVRDFKPYYVFGVDAEDYLECMSSVKLVKGIPWEKGWKAAMISANTAKKLEADVNNSSVQLLVTSGIGIKVRVLPITGIYEYKNENPLLDNIVLVNPETMRDMLEISDVSTADDIVLSEEQENFLGDLDIDSLFSDAEDYSDTVSTEEVAFTEEEMEAMNASYSSSAWNFLICRLNDPKNTKEVIKSLNKTFAKNEWDVEAVNWRSSAGNTAFYLYLLRLILNIGIIVVLGAGFIVVNNTLVINVLDRIREIGTMRAIGANKRYISKECMAETLIMAVISGILGCILGVLAAQAVNAVHVTFHNSFLVQLFGGNTLVTAIKLSNIAGSFSVALFIGLIAWVYPVINALRVNPVQAMQGAK